MKSLNVNFYVDNRREFLLLQLTAVLFYRLIPDC